MPVLGSPTTKTGELGVGKMMDAAVGAVVSVVGVMVDAVVGVAAAVADGWPL